MSEKIDAVMQRWTADRDAEWSEQNEEDAIRIADHACSVLPKVREALEAAQKSLSYPSAHPRRDAFRRVREALKLMEASPTK